jgi:hypothetical protein
MAFGMEGQSPANLMQHLKGVDFPASKEELLDHAKQTEGKDTQDMIAFFERLPNKEFDSPADLLQEANKSEEKTEG